MYFWETNKTRRIKESTPYTFGIRIRTSVTRISNMQRGNRYLQRALTKEFSFFLCMLAVLLSPCIFGPLFSFKAHVFNFLVRPHHPFQLLLGHDGYFGIGREFPVHHIPRVLRTLQELDPRR